MIGLIRDVKFFVTQSQAFGIDKLATLGPESAILRDELSFFVKGLNPVSIIFRDNDQLFVHDQAGRAIKLPIVSPEVAELENEFAVLVEDLHTVITEFRNVEIVIIILKEDIRRITELAITGARATELREKFPIFVEKLNAMIGKICHGDLVVNDRCRDRQIEFAITTSEATELKEKFIVPPIKDLNPVIIEIRYEDPVLIESHPIRMTKLPIPFAEGAERVAEFSFLIENLNPVISEIRNVEPLVIKRESGGVIKLALLRPETAKYEKWFRIGSRFAESAGLVLGDTRDRVILSAAEKSREDHHQRQQKQFSHNYASLSLTMMSKNC
jgi:hypothetical protein